MSIPPAFLDDEAPYPVGPPGQVTAQVQQLNQAVDQLAKAQALLVERLGPVLSPIPDDPEGGGGPVDMALARVPLAEELAHLVDNVGAVTAGLEQLLRRCEL